jgi:hypothetical protein
MYKSIPTINKFLEFLAEWVENDRCNFPVFQVLDMFLYGCMLHNLNINIVITSIETEVDRHAYEREREREREREQ